MKSDFTIMCEKYEEHFHRSYGVFGEDLRPLEEHIRIMEEAIKNGTPVKCEPDDPRIYDPDPAKRIRI